MTMIDQISQKYPARVADMVWIGVLLTEWTNQTNATAKIWGTSGRGNSTLVGIFRAFCELKIIETRREGRSILYRSTPALTEWANTHELRSSVMEAD